MEVSVAGAAGLGMLVYVSCHGRKSIPDQEEPEIGNKAREMVLMVVAAVTTEQVINQAGHLVVGQSGMPVERPSTPFAGNFAVADPREFIGCIPPMLGKRT